MSIVSTLTSSLSPFPILICLCFFIFIFLKLFPKFIPLAILFNYIIPVSYHLKWAWDFSLHCSLFPNYSHQYLNHPENGDHLGRFYKPDPESKEVAECAVCLCKIEEGEEIREVIRCGHMFHRECLARWVGHGNNNGTCPLCRCCLDPPRMMNDLGEEVIIFNFSLFSSRTDNRSTWWLR